MQGCWYRRKVLAQAGKSMFVDKKCSCGWERGGAGMFALQIKNLQSQQNLQETGF